MPRGPSEVRPDRRNRPVRRIHVPYPSTSANRANTSLMGRSIVARVSYRTLVLPLFLIYRSGFTRASQREECFLSPNGDAIDGGDSAHRQVHIHEVGSPEAE